MERWHLPEVSGSHHHLVAVAARAGHGGAEADGHGGLAAANHVEHVGAAVAVLLLVELPHVRPARAERPVNLEEEGAYNYAFYLQCEESMTLHYPINASVWQGAQVA